MGRKPKGEIMTPTEMIDMGNQKRSTSKIYKAEAMEITDGAISQTVAKALSELIHVAQGNKIDLNNIDMVKSVSLQYGKSCAETSTFPTMTGLARALGVTSRNLYYWMTRKKETETGQWLLLCHDLYTDVLAETSLRNNCNSIVSIFLLKALYGLRDNVTIELNQLDHDPDEPTIDQIRAKYLNLISDDD